MFTQSPLKTYLHLANRERENCRLIKWTRFTSLLIPPTNIDASASTKWNWLRSVNFKTWIQWVGVIHLVRTQLFRKTNISYPLICTRTCAYQGVRNVSFSGNFAYVPKNHPSSSHWYWLVQVKGFWCLYH